MPHAATGLMWDFKKEALNTRCLHASDLMHIADWHSIYVVCTELTFTWSVSHCCVLQDNDHFHVGQIAGADEGHCSKERLQWALSSCSLDSARSNSNNVALLSGCCTNGNKFFHWYISYMLLGAAVFVRSSRYIQMTLTDSLVLMSTFLVITTVISSDYRWISLVWVTWHKASHIYPLTKNRSAGQRK